MSECLGRGLVGLPAFMQKAVDDGLDAIQPGTTIFLYNITQRMLFGIFEATSYMEENLVPNFCTLNKQANSSPLPLQVQIRVVLECPPLEDDDAVLNHILRGTRGLFPLVQLEERDIQVSFGGDRSRARETRRSRGHRIGPITFAETEAIASLMSSRCGALQYMVQCRTDVDSGRGEDVLMPPIALPPKRLLEKIRQEEEEERWRRENPELAKRKDEEAKKAKEAMADAN